MLIDISNNQGNIDFASLKEVVSGVIIRCGWGGDYSKQDDPKFNEYVAGCEKYGIPYGVYLYSYALNTDAAISEAKHTLRMIAGKRITYGVWFDMEDADGYKRNHGVNPYQNRQLLTDICKVYCEALKSAGYDAGVYANWDYWKNVLYKDQLSEYPIWLAQWEVSAPSMPCRIWQYTSHGTVAGIKGRVDCDIWYGDAVSVPAEKVETPADIIPVDLPLIKKGSRGLVVKLWQLIVNVAVDGIFGPKTEQATKDFQSRNKLVIDGIVGDQTWNKAFDIIRKV